MKQLVYLSLLVLFLLSACGPQQPAEAATAPSSPAAQVQSPVTTSMPSTMAEANGVLVKFLTFLHTGKYAQAVPLYGGDYEALQSFNSEIDPADRVALWTWACDNQLLQCLEVRSTEFKNISGDSYIFQVEFSNPDGSLFVLGPCCGANETEMPPVSQFEYTVSRDAEHRYVVMNPPPYVP